MIAIVASPVVAFTIAFLAMVVLARIQRRWGVHSDAKAFKGLQLVSAAAVSFGHGANDAQKTMGIMAALAVRRRLHRAAARRQPGDRLVDPAARLLRDRGRHDLGRLEDHRDDGVADHHACGPARVWPPTSAR